MEEAPKFSSPAEEIEYWKVKARGFEQQAREVKEEFEEFQEGSKELEQELEAQLEQAEKSVKEFKSLANRLQIENDSLKDKLEQCNKEYHYQVLRKMGKIIYCKCKCKLVRFWTNLEARE